MDLVGDASAAAGGAHAFPMIYTAAFTAPEYLQPITPLSSSRVQAQDIWSLGCLLVFMLINEVAFSDQWTPPRDIVQVPIPKEVLDSFGAHVRSHQAEWVSNPCFTGIACVHFARAYVISGAC